MPVVNAMDPMANGYFGAGEPVRIPAPGHMVANGLIDAMAHAGGLIAEELELLNQAVSGLHNNLADLARRIEPALGPDLPNAASVGIGKPRPMPSPLAGRIADLAAGVRDAAAKVSDLSARVQL